MAPLAKTAKYESLYKFLANEIAEGRYEVGDQLPTESQLCDMCGVSRTTIRLAIDQLVEDGVLSRKQGRGTFVLKKPRTARPKVERPRGVAKHFRVISAGPFGASQEIATLFGLAGEGEIYAIRRLRLVDGHPSAIKRYYAPMSVFGSPATKAELTSVAFDNMLRDRKVHIARTNLSAKPMFLSKTDADLLEVAEGALSLFAQRVGYDANGRIVRVSETVLAAERAALHWSITHPYGRVPSSEVISFSSWTSAALD